MGKEIAKDGREFLMVALLDDVIPSVEEIMFLGEQLAEYMPLAEDHNAFHNSSARFRWLFGGNQSGKSHTNMADCALYTMGVHPTRPLPKKSLVWVCIESWEQIRDIIWNDKLSEMLPSHAVSNIIYGQDRVPKKLYMKNGCTIEFKAFNQGRELFQGRPVNAIYCDEQCCHDFQGIFQEIQARLLVKDGTLSWSMTPIIPQPFLEERIDDLPQTDEVFFANLNDNRKSVGGYIADERVDEMIEDWAEEVQATRIEGRFASFYGAVYKTFVRRRNVIEPFTIPPSWPRYRGFDFGFTNPFVCLWVAESPDGEYYVYREYYKAKTGIRSHIANVLRRSHGERFVRSFADPEDAEARRDLRDHGIPNFGARKDVAAGIEMVQSLIKPRPNGKPRLFIFKTCKNTIREISGYHYPDGTSRNNPKDHPAGVNDHTCDALRYIIFTLLRKGRRGKIAA